MPEYAGDLCAVNWARLCSAVQQTRDEIVAMTLPNAMHLPVQCMSNDDFQVCANCARQTLGLILRHWRFAWSLTCEACGRSLVARHPADRISNRLHLRAARGAATLKTAVQANDLRCMRRIALTLYVLKLLGGIHGATHVAERVREVHIACDCGCRHYSSTVGRCHLAVRKRQGILGDPPHLSSAPSADREGAQAVARPREVSSAPTESRAYAKARNAKSEPTIRVRWCLAGSPPRYL